MGDRGKCTLFMLENNGIRLQTSVIYIEWASGARELTLLTNRLLYRIYWAFSSLVVYYYSICWALLGWLRLFHTCLVYIPNLQELLPLIIACCFSDVLMYTNAYGDSWAADEHKFAKHVVLDVRVRYMVGAIAVHK